jgi:subtilase family serine protease
VTVDFRWYDADGTELARARQRSGRCRQFERLPNLVVRIGSVTPTSVNGVVRYEALVTNTGRAEATKIPVQLAVDGDIVNTVTLTSLGPGEQRSLAIRGPACSRTVRLEADPDELIAESSDEDNADDLSCAPVMKLG